VGDLSGRNFGLVIAYVIPGFIVLWGLSHVSEPVRAWMVGAGTAGPSVGGALYVALASLGCGMTASLFRWLLVDTLHHRTGVTRPVLDETKLPERLAAFDYLVENHYRYYQFYGNSAVALSATLAAMPAESGLSVFVDRWRARGDRSLPAGLARLAAQVLLPELAAPGRREGVR